MVATVSIRRSTGGTSGSPGTETDIDALGPPAFQGRSDDSPVSDATGDVQIPDAGTNYSYVASLYLYCDSAPDTQIDNVQFYTDGANGYGTGIGLVIGDELPTHNSGATTGYRPATGTAGSTGNEMVAGPYTGVITGVTDVFTYTSGSAKTITISEAGSIINAMGESTNYFVLQFTVASTASPHTSANETLTIQYDEV